MSAVLYDQAGPVVTITLNRPDQMNAINEPVRRGLFEAFERFENEDSAKVAILTATGERAFCAGMDLKEASDKSLGLAPKGFLPVVGENIHLSKPTIAAVNGIAVAGGWLFAQMCDICIASATARFGITEARVGRGMPWATPLTTMIQQRALMELLLTGDLIDAHRALEIGFVNRVVAPSELIAEAQSMAMRIAGNAPLTVRAARELVYLSTEMGRSAARRAADVLFDPVYRSADALEGPKAFAEKRPPKWLGR